MNFHTTSLDAADGDGDDGGGDCSALSNISEGRIRCTNSLQLILKKAVQNKHLQTHGSFLEDEPHRGLDEIRCVTVIVVAVPATLPTTYI